MFTLSNMHFYCPSVTGYNQMDLQCNFAVLVSQARTALSRNNYFQVLVLDTTEFTSSRSLLYNVQCPKYIPRTLSRYNKFMVRVLYSYVPIYLQLRCMRVPPLFKPTASLRGLAQYLIPPPPPPPNNIPLSNKIWDAIIQQYIMMEY